MSLLTANFKNKCISINDIHQQQLDDELSLLLKNLYHL